MRQLTSIVAVNQDGVIGCRNSLPWRIRSDMAFFKATTAKNVVIMGRKTHDSLGRCLPDRYNVVLSKQFGLFADQVGCIQRTGLMEGLASAEQSPKSYKEIYVIGGSTMYDQFDQYVDRYLITVVNKPVKNGDAFFDLSIMNNTKDWIVSRVIARTQGPDDEAEFEIFELVARDADRRRAKREAAIAPMMNRTANKPVRRHIGYQDCSAPLAFDWR